ncbi:MAG: YciI family protein [Rhizomicrobium sp.]
MLYAILCYDTENAVFSWSEAQERKVMEDLRAVQDTYRKAGKLGPVARLMPTTAATTLRKGDTPLVLDGPFAETKEQLLGFYLFDAADLDEVLGFARALGAVNPGGAYEIRPLLMFDKGNLGDAPPA